MARMTTCQLSQLHPEELDSRSTFDCGHDALNLYLAKTASQHEKRNVTRSFCAVRSARIVGFYSLTNASVDIAALSPEILRRYRLPTHALPVVRLGRLAVDRHFQRQGIGARLLVDAMQKVLSVAEVSGCVGLVVDAKDRVAAAYYTAFGFRAAPENSLILFMPLPEIQELFRAR